MKATGSRLTRRTFLGRAAGAVGALSLGSQTGEALAWGTAPDPLRGRFVTHVSVVRVNQIEVTPTRSIGEDESPDNRPEHIRVAAGGICARLPGWQDDLGDQLAGAE